MHKFMSTQLILYILLFFSITSIFFIKNIFALSPINIKILKPVQSPYTYYTKLSSVILANNNFKSVKVQWNLPSGVFIKKGSLVNYWTSVSRGEHLLNTISFVVKKGGLYPVSVSATAYSQTESNFVASDSINIFYNKNLNLTTNNNLYYIESYVFDGLKILILLLYIFFIYKISIFLYKQFRIYLNS